MNLFRPPASASFTVMQAPFSSQVRPCAAPSTLPPGGVPPSAFSNSTVFTTLSLASAFASTIVSVQHAASSAFPQPNPGLLPPPVGPRAPIPLDHMTRDFISTRHFRTAFGSRERQTSHGQYPRSLSQRPQPPMAHKPLGQTPSDQRRRRHLKQQP